MSAIDRWRVRWERSGFDTVPLWPNEKRPMCMAWQHEPPAVQWREAKLQSVGAGWRPNIGVRAGNGLAIIDGDDPASRKAIAAWLDGLGLELPLVRTASGDGCHWYSRIDGAPTEGSYRRIASDVGKGEIRFGPGSQTAAPSSRVDGQQYRFLRGSPETLAGLPAVQWREFAWLLANEKPQSTKRKTTSKAPGLATVPPIPLQWRELSPKVYALLDQLRTATKAQNVGKYKTRSEAEAGIVAISILMGWRFDDVQRLFEQWQPGHYAEAGKHAGSYLVLTWRNVLSDIAANNVRAHVASVYRIAQVSAWPGRGGMLERTVYCGLLAHCWQWSSWEVSASQRDLAQLAAASRTGVSNALERLQRSGWLSLRSKAPRWQGMANFYRVLPLPGKEGFTQKHPNMTYGLILSQTELWGQGGLGRSAGAVYALLGNEPSSVEGLATATEKHSRTVYRALERLLAFGLTGKTSAGYIRGAADVRQVAREFDTDRKATRRRMRHIQERKNFKAWQATKAPDVKTLGRKLGAKVRAFPQGKR